jgi:hypothetical protein
VVEQDREPVLAVEVTLQRQAEAEVVGAPALVGAVDGQVVDGAVVALL